MKKILYILFICFNINVVSALETKIIYVIENEIITNIDIKNEFRYLLALNSKLKNLNNEKILKIASESIIKEKIKKIEISKNFSNFNVDKRYSDALLKNIYKGLNFQSLDEFNSHLKPYNLDVDDIRKKLAIDALWNELIIRKYNSKIEIDEEKLKNKIMSSAKNETKEYNLSEIVFEIKDKKDIKKKYLEIKESIIKIGFENSASIYSISDTSKIGGNIGWIREESLNSKIVNNISTLKLDQISRPIIIPNGILILKIKEIKKTTSEIDFDNELKKLINYEKNRQLNQYSKIYFNKVRKNIGFNE
ncbi:peptidylprolyl isomerase [Candidatus Pelagibacter sp. Uisw_090]|uniref:peptidylprolyl isomerase n=1 Tax=Candidatus Pelagibacter sp. Uisw_090 TaxID=3230993 RepID=UPI0039ED46DC